jgi:Flp pilus assembly protein CpaB
MAQTEDKPAIAVASAKPSNRSLWIALALGLLAALVNLAYLSGSQGTQLTVLQAKQRIRAGSAVTADDFTPIQISGQALAEMRKLVVEPGTLQAFSEIPLAESIEPGQVLLQSSFHVRGSRTVQQRIGPDERGVPMRVKEESAASCQPGNMVDVWINAGTEMQLVISKVTVLSVDGETTVRGSDSGGGGGTRTALVAVPADQVADILRKLEILGKGEVTLAQHGGR